MRRSLPLRVLPILAVMVLAAAGPLRLETNYSLVEEYWLEESGAGRGVLTYRILTEEFHRQAIDEENVRLKCQEGHARLVSFNARHGLEEAADFSEVRFEYAFDRPEDMRVFYKSLVRFGAWSKEQIRRKLNDEEFESVRDVVTSLPSEQRTYFFMLSEPLEEGATEYFDDPRSVQGKQFCIRTIVHLPMRLLATNGMAKERDPAVIQWEYPLVGMQTHRMIYLVMLTHKPRYEIYVGIVLSVLVVMLAFYAVLWHRRRKRAGII